MSPRRIQEEMLEKARQNAESTDENSRIPESKLSSSFSKRKRKRGKKNGRKILGRYRDVYELMVIPDLIAISEDEDEDLSDS